MTQEQQNALLSAQGQTDIDRAVADREHQNQATIEGRDATNIELALAGYQGPSTTAGGSSGVPAAAPAQQPRSHNPYPRTIGRGQIYSGGGGGGGRYERGRQGAGDPYTQSNIGIAF